MSPQGVTSFCTTIRGSIGGVSMSVFLQSARQRAHPALVLSDFALTPLANLRHFLICALLFSVEHPLVGCLLLLYSLICDVNIIFDLYIKVLRPFLQVCHQGVKQRPGVFDRELIALKANCDELLIKATRLIAMQRGFRQHFRRHVAPCRKCTFIVGIKMASCKTSQESGLKRTIGNCRYARTVHK